MKAYFENTDMAESNSASSTSARIALSLLRFKLKLSGESKYFFSSQIQDKNVVKLHILARTR